MQNPVQLVMKKVNRIIMNYLFIETYYFIKDMDHAIIMQKLIILMQLVQQKNLVVLINHDLFHQNDHHHQQYEKMFVFINKNLFERIVCF